MVTGKFDFDSMVMAAPLLGPIVFFVFVLVTTIVLVNIFLTLIISAFETVKHDVMKQDNEYEIVDFMKKKVKSMLGLYQFTNETDQVVDEKERELKLIEEQIAILPAKIDHMLHFVNKMHYKGQLNLKSDHKRSTPLEAEQSRNVTGRKTVLRANGRRNRRRSSQNGRNDEAAHNVPRIAFLNWNEVTD